MAIYKPSNLSPNLQEIDLTQENEFSCQVNTSGSSVYAYKMQILSGSNQLVFDKKPANLPQKVRNKAQFGKTLKVDGDNVVVDGENFPLEEGMKLVNGKDYQWNVRTYSAPVGSTEQPDTTVCTGFLVGTTKYVVWLEDTGVTDEIEISDDIKKLEVDRWIEFKTDASKMMPILEPNTENLVLPENEYTERHKISWVENQLGWNKNITKIELDDSFKYNYINGTEFQLYLCSDQHTLTSVYVEPNDDIERGMYIELYNGETLMVEKTKIIGYGEETGEIRVQESFPSIPQNGWIYKLYTKDNLADEPTYKEVVSEGVTMVVGGTPITSDLFKIMTNHWDNNLQQLFVQPNINIKSDETNPNEIVFENGVRLDINQVMNKNDYVPNKTVDATFDKLDNTQWLLRGNLTRGDSTFETVPIIPKTNYTVYTDFMDAMPNAIVYARQTPVLTMQYKDLMDFDSGFQNINIDPVPWRDIEFQTIWDSSDRVLVKVYKYYLYAITPYGQEDLIVESDDIYDSDLVWSFKGFETQNFYRIRVVVTDQYGNQYSTYSDFTTIYSIQDSKIPLTITPLCEEHGIHVNIVAPVYVETTNTESDVTVDYSDIQLLYDSLGNPIAEEYKDENGLLRTKQKQYLNIPNGKVLNYTNILDIDKTPIELPENFTFLTKIKIPTATREGGENFFSDIVGTEMKTMLEVCCQNRKEYYIAPNEVLKEAMSDPTLKDNIYISLIQGAEEVDGKRKIVSYNYETGQVVVENGFNFESANTLMYKLFKYDSDIDMYLILNYTGDANIDVGSYLYTIKVGGTETFVLSNGSIQKNPNQFKMRMYKNSFDRTEEQNKTPLVCFNDNGAMKDYYDFSVALDNLIIPTNVHFILQDGTDYIIKDQFAVPPSINELGQKCLLTQDCVLNGETYYIGEYICESINGAYKWSIVLDTQYFYLDSTENAGTDENGNIYTYEKLGVPMELRENTNTGSIRWGDKLGNDDKYLWMDEGHALKFVNEQILASKYFWIYIVVNNNKEESPVECFIDIEDVK